MFDIDNLISLGFRIWAFSMLDILVNDYKFSYIDAMNLISNTINDYLNGLGSSVSPSK